MKALNDMGIKTMSAKTEGQQIEARGYKADIVMPQQNNYDVAFRNNGETYELVTDLQFWQQ